MSRYHRYRVRITYDDGRTEQYTVSARTRHDARVIGELRAGGSARVTVSLA